MLAASGAGLTVRKPRRHRSSQAAPTVDGGFLLDSESYMAVLGIHSGSIGLGAPLRFKTLDSQPDSPNMGPVPTDCHDFRLFQKSCHGFLARYLSCFRPNRPKVGFSSFLVGTKKMGDEKLRRFVVVSPREVPSLPVSLPFKIFICWAFLKVQSLFPSLPSRKSVHKFFPSTVSSYKLGYCKL